MRTTSRQPRIEVVVRTNAQRLGVERGRREKELVDASKQKGPAVFMSEVKAFQDHSNGNYLASPLSKSWPEGMLERINAL